MPPDADLDALLAAKRSLEHARLLCDSEQSLYFIETSLEQLGAAIHALESVQ